MENEFDTMLRISGPNNIISSEHYAQRSVNNSDRKISESGVALPSIERSFWLEPPFLRDLLQYTIRLELWDPSRQISLNTLVLILLNQLSRPRA